MKLLLISVLLCSLLFSCEKRDSRVESEKTKPATAQFSNTSDKEKGKAKEQAASQKDKALEKKPELTDEEGFKGEAKRIRDKQEQGLRDLNPFKR